MPTPVRPEFETTRSIPLVNRTLKPVTLMLSVVEAASVQKPAHKFFPAPSTRLIWIVLAVANGTVIEMVLRAPEMPGAVIP